MTAEAVAGVLGDGTRYYAPFGEVVADESRVTCHLCGRTFRSVPAHLASHGWTKERYCEAFGLERGQSLALRHGYPDIHTFVLARVQAGDSLAAISRAAGLHKDWLSRHLRQVDPAGASLARQQATSRLDGPWLPTVRRLGFTDVPSYLRDRHHAQHQTVNAIAAETGLSPHRVESALLRHGLAVVAHTAKRHAARQRADSVAAALGHASMAAYIRQRRADGWTWKAMAAESGQSATWLRRQGAAQPHG